MLKLERYIEVTGESRRNVFLKLADGRLLRKIISGELYVIQPSEISKLNDKQKALILSDKKKEWDARISFANQNKELRSDVIKEISEDVAGYVSMGFKVVGYNEKTLYKKISTGKTTRSTRKDKSTYKNSILSKPDIQKKILDLATQPVSKNEKGLYFQDTRGSIRFLADRIQYIAKQREDLYEIAAIPFPTLYRFLNNNLTESGLKEVHVFENHHDQWNKNKPFVEGAFTSDINFMDWLSLDDHMIQIAGVEVYNELKNKVEVKTVYTWFVVEAKTMMPIAYDIKIRDFNSTDIKLLFMQALMNVGKPVKGFLFDNGLASANSNLQMLNQLGINYRTAKPYNPTGKATMERFFGLLNSECSVLINNYIGGKRIDGRHTSLKLSPEAPMITEKDLIELIDNYIQGFFLDRPRTRKIGSETKRISTREYYEKEYTSFVPEFCDPKQLRFAFMDNVIKKFNGQMIKLGKHGCYIPNDALPPALHNRYYDIRYNLLDMNEIDLYNIDPLRVGDNFILDKGKYVTTLYSMKNKGNAEKQELVNKTWKQHRKALKDAAQTTTDLVVLNDSNRPTTFASPMTIVDTRKTIRQKVMHVLNDETQKLTQVNYGDSAVTVDESPSAELTYDSDATESILTFDNGKDS